MPDADTVPWPLHVVASEYWHSEPTNPWAHWLHGTDTVADTTVAVHPGSQVHAHADAFGFHTTVPCPKHVTAREHEHVGPAKPLRHSVHPAPVKGALHVQCPVASTTPRPLQVVAFVKAHAGPVCPAMQDEHVGGTQSGSHTQFPLVSIAPFWLHTAPSAYWQLVPT